MISSSPLAQEKIWADKAVYDLAEKRFYEKLAKQQVCSSSPSNKELKNEESKSPPKQCFIGLEKDGAGKYKSPEKVWVSKHIYDLAEKEYYEKLEKSRLESLGKLQDKVVNEKLGKVEVEGKVSDSTDAKNVKDSKSPLANKQLSSKNLQLVETKDNITENQSQNNLDPLANVIVDSEEVQNTSFTELLTPDKSVPTKLNEKKKPIVFSSPRQKVIPVEDNILKTEVIDPESKKRLRLEEPLEFKENPKPQKIRLTEEKYLSESGKEKRKPTDEKKSQDNVAKGVSQNGNSWNSLAGEVAKARQHIKNSLQCIDDIASITSSNVVVEVNNRINSLEKENSEMKQKVKELTDLLAKFEQRLTCIEKGSPSLAFSKPPTVTVSSQAAKPQTTTAASQSKPSTATVSSQSSKPVTANVSSQSSKPACDDDEDDGVDLFASESEEEDDEAAKIKEQRLAEYAAKKSKKPALIAKSSIVLDVKPWDDTTDMKVMEKEVRKIATEGLLWGASKLVPLAYGIHKLQISCVVEDEKVSVDWLQETIEQIEDYVQSVDIAAFNKI